MTSWLGAAWDAFKTQLWPIPGVAVVAALGLGLGLPAFDTRDGELLSSGVSTWLFGGDADAARSLLGAIASSLITVTALTFSLTVVTLQLASSQFSPRLLGTFASDRFVQVTLALFLATFTFALTLLRAVRSAGESGQTEFVPRLGVTLAFALAVASVLALVLFLAHLVEQIRVETMLRNVRREAERTMRAVLPERRQAQHDIQAEARPPDGAVELRALGDGFVTRIEHRDLLRLAIAEDAVLYLGVHPGSFVVAGTRLGAVWPRSGGRFDRQAAERLSARVPATVHLGFERTAAQDVGHGLRQLVDVANKALSPGINDPTTAVHALGHISAFLCDLSDRDLGPERLKDEEGRVRVTLHRPDLASYVDLGLSQPRRYGAADPQVLEKIFRVLLDLSHRVFPDQRQMILDQLERLRGTVEEQSFDSYEREALADQGREIERTLGGGHAHDEGASS